MSDNYFTQKDLDRKNQPPNIITPSKEEEKEKEKNESMSSSSSIVISCVLVFLCLFVLSLCLYDNKLLNNLIASFMMTGAFWLLYSPSKKKEENFLPVNIENIPSLDSHRVSFVLESEKPFALLPGKTYNISSGIDILSKDQFSVTDESIYEGLHGFIISKTSDRNINPVIKMMNTTDKKIQIKERVKFMMITFVFNGRAMFKDEGGEEIVGNDITAPIITKQDPVGLYEEKTDYQSLVHEEAKQEGSSIFSPLKNGGSNLVLIPKHNLDKLLKDPTDPSNFMYEKTVFVPLKSPIDNGSSSSSTSSSIKSN